MTAKRTVNDKIGTALLFLKWLRDTGRSCNEDVTLPGERDRRVIRSSAPWGEWVKAIEAAPSPVLFRRVGTASKHRVGFVVSEATLASVQRALLESPINTYAAHRNELIAQIGTSTGLR